MPANKNRYSEGGVFMPPAGRLPGEGAVEAIDVTCSDQGAGRGTGYGAPSMTKGGDVPPGGYGSSGTRSSSSPSS